MPTYVYGCGVHGTFEERAGLNDQFLPCPTCHEPARRRPFSGVPHLKGETVSKDIPDPQYRQQAQARELRQTWGTAERSMELIRAHRREDSQGRVSIDTAAITRES